MRWIELAVTVMIVLGTAGCSHAGPSADQIARTLREGLIEFATGTDASLRGLSAIDTQTAWASGSGGTILRTTTGGLSWRNVSIADAAGLDLRMIHAFDADRACALSAGSPARLYRTENGGATWTLVYEDRRPEIFFDAMRLEGEDFGIAFGDPIDGRLQIISTRDGGRTWRPHGQESCPASLPGEAGFAASNSALAISGRTVCIGLGGATGVGVARIAMSGDRGQSWVMRETPLAASASSGVFSVALADGGRLALAVGGNYLVPDDGSGTAAVSIDGGKSWRVPDGPGPRGYRSGLAFIPSLGAGVALAVGPSGADVTTDSGRSWLPVALGAWHAVQTSRDGSSVWVSGAAGRVGRIVVPDHR